MNKVAQGALYKMRQDFFYKAGCVSIALMALFCVVKPASAQIPTLEEPETSPELLQEAETETLETDTLELIGPSQPQPDLEPETTETLEFNPSQSNYIDQSNYILGPGDRVNITVFAYEEYTGERAILPDGTITLPLVGPIQAAGLTTEQFAQELTVRLQALLVNPVVTVELTALRPVTVTVAGEVRRPGPINLSEVTENIPTLSQALLSAGGITQDADIRQVTVQRNLPNGESQSIVVNLWEAIASDNAPSDVILQEGDSIFVPRLSADAELDRRLITRSSFAPATVRVRVIGEVKSPGEIEVSPDSTLSSAVAIAGGPTEDARLSRVAFIRMDETGRIEREVVDLRNLIDNYQVQEGDVIIVPRQSASSILDVASRFVISPLNSILGLFLGLDRFVDAIGQ